jgi:hypothetical protein
VVNIIMTITRLVLKTRRLYSVSYGYYVTGRFNNDNNNHSIYCNAYNIMLVITYITYCILFTVRYAYNRNGIQKAITLRDVLLLSWCGYYFYSISNSRTTQTMPDTHVTYNITNSHWNCIHSNGRCTKNVANVMCSIIQNFWKVKGRTYIMA